MTMDFEHRLAEAVRDLGSQHDSPHTLQRMVEITPEFFHSSDYVGVSVVERDRIRTPVASTETLRRLDEVQYELRQGPCLEAIRREATIVVDDLATDERWPDWGRRMVAELGVRASISFRLFSSDDTWGALNVYSRQPRAFDQDDVRHGQVIAAMCAVALARSVKDDQLQSALETRTVIGQATGIVMERYGLDADTAFKVMRRLSSEHNRKLRDLAAEVVAERHLPRSAGASED